MLEVVFDGSDELLVFQIVLNLPWDLEILYKVPQKVHEEHIMDHL